MSVSPECIGYDESVPVARSSQSEATRFSGRMFNILAINPTRVKERRAGLFEGNPVLCVVADNFLGIPFEHSIMYILNSNKETSCYRGSDCRRAAEHILNHPTVPGTLLQLTGISPLLGQRA